MEEDDLRGCRFERSFYTLRDEISSLSLRNIQGLHFRSFDKNSVYTYNVLAELRCISNSKTRESSPPLYHCNKRRQ